MSVTDYLEYEYEKDPRSQQNATKVAKVLESFLAFVSDSGHKIGQIYTRKDKDRNPAETCRVARQLDLYIKNQASWGAQTRYLRFSQIRKYLMFAGRSAGFELKADARALFQKFFREYHKKMYEEYQEKVKTKHIMSLASLSNYIPSMAFFTRLLSEGIEKALKKNYTYILGAIALYLLVTCGCRNSDLVNVTYENVTDAKQREDFWVIQVKNHKTGRVYGAKYIFLPPTLYKVLMALGRYNQSRNINSVFNRPGGGQTENAFITYIIRRYGAYHNVPENISSHLIRVGTTHHFMFRGTEEQRRQCAQILMHSESTQKRSYVGRLQIDAALENHMMLQKALSTVREGKIIFILFEQSME